MKPSILPNWLGIALTLAGGMLLLAGPAWTLIAVGFLLTANTVIQHYRRRHRKEQQQAARLDRDHEQALIDLARGHTGRDQFIW
jgi:membrane protein implicated in regulation of membrane protease activity